MFHRATSDEYPIRLPPKYVQITKDQRIQHQTAPHAYNGFKGYHTKKEPPPSACSLILPSPKPPAPKPPPGSAHPAAIGTPPRTGTSALPASARTPAAIPATPVNYSSSMIAPSFRTLALSNTLSITASGFVIDEQGASSTALTIATNANLSIGANMGVTITNAAGSINIPNGWRVDHRRQRIFPRNQFVRRLDQRRQQRQSLRGVITINSGATMTVDKVLLTSPACQASSSSTVAISIAAGSGINESQNDGNQSIAIASGAAYLGDFSVTRCNNSTAGLLLTNGVVNATSIRIGIANSVASSTVFGGALTNTGAFNISDTTNITATSGDRNPISTRRVEPSFPRPLGASSLPTNPTIAVRPRPAAASSAGVSDVTGGTLIAEKITLIRDNTITNAYASFTLSGGTVYLGSGGLAMNTGAAHIGRNLALSGGTLGAKASWSSSAPISIANTVTLKAADSASNPFNISLTGAITNTGSYHKNRRRLAHAFRQQHLRWQHNRQRRCFSSWGSECIAEKATGLTLGSSGNNFATVDLAGLNVQISNLALGSGATPANQLITNSSAASTSTITFSNGASSTFGGIIAGGVKPIALTVLGGSLTLSGQNVYAGNIVVSAGTLTLNGAGSTFTGPSIVLSNSAVLDASGMGGFTLGLPPKPVRNGSVGGNVTAENCPVTPSTLGVAGQPPLHSARSVTSHFDLGLDPSSPGNDLITVTGTFSASGVNTIDVAPLAVLSSAGTYKLIKFGSLGSGQCCEFPTAARSVPVCRLRSRLHRL